jgi:hypothetical protein
MAAATAAPVRHRIPRAAGVMPQGALRLLRVELRRNAMPWILPLIAALFWFDSYRPSTATAPLYAIRTFWNMGQGHTIIDFGPFVAGVAAWMGSRDGRRGLADLVTTTARPRWAGQLGTWAATAIWAVVAYLIFVGVMFAAYAHQGVGGSPPWWSVAVGATAVAAFTAFGFAVGVYWPSRFAAPVAAFGGFLAMSQSSQAGFRDPSGWALILPTNSNGSFDGNAQADSGIFYHWLPDLQIARIIFLAGIALLALGLTGLPARAGGKRLRIAAAVLVVAGVASAGTAIGLTASSRVGAHGVVISALHDAASDKPIAYTPVCGHVAGIGVCVAPAYQRWLPDVNAALAPVLSEVAGLPGGPVRATQIAAADAGGHGGPPPVVSLGGQPPVTRLLLGNLNMPGPCGFCAGPVVLSEFNGQIRLNFVQAFIGVNQFTDHGSPVQLAVQAVLLQEAGVPFAAQPKLITEARDGPGASPGPAAGPVYAAARRFAALSASARQHWLAAHLAAVRAGGLALKDLS